MKTTWMRIIGSPLAVLLLAISAVSAQSRIAADSSRYYMKETEYQKRNQFLLGMGITASSGYKNALQDAYPDREISGGFGWIYMDVGFAFQVAPGISITPQLDMLATFIEYQSYEGFPGSKKATVILLPSAGMKYEFSRQPSTVFASGDLTLVVPASDLDKPALKSGGVGFKLALGYSFSREYELALSYQHVPIKVGTVSENYGGGISIDARENTKNFGGIGITLRRAWSF